MQSQTSYTIISWNVNGYKDDIHNWLRSFAENNLPDVIFLSETKKTVEELTLYFSQFSAYNIIYNVHKPKHWHGVVMMIRKDHKFEQFEINMGINPRADCKDPNPTCGRIISVALDGKFYLVGTYTPNSGAGNPMKYLDFRLNHWDKSFFQALNIMREKGGVIWMGDINLAPSEIDASNPKVMSKWAGFTLEERASFNSFLTNDWIDIWRKQHPDSREYSWRGSYNSMNYGLRLDNIIISKDLEPYVTNSFMIHNCQNSSDHIPISIQLTV